MKKIICLMLCAAMVLGVAGCMRQTPETAIHNYFKEIKKTVTLTLNLKVDSEQSLAVVEKFLVMKLLVFKKMAKIKHSPL